MYMQTILEALMNTKKYQQIQEAPDITLYENRLTDVLSEKEQLTFEDRDDIMSGVACYVLACEKAAILYGMSVAREIQKAECDPICCLNDMNEVEEDEQ